MNGHNQAYQAKMSIRRTEGIFKFFVKVFKTVQKRIHQSMCTLHASLLLNLFIFSENQIERKAKQKKSGASPTLDQLINIPYLLVTNQIENR